MIDTKERRQVLGAVSPEEVEELLDRLEAAEKERDNLRTENEGLVEDMNLLRNNNVVLRAKIAEMERQEPSREWWDNLIADISAIDCEHRGHPSYTHDAYWLREHVTQMLEHRRDALPGVKGE